MVWGPRIKEAAIKAGDIQPADITLVDLKWFLSSFSPGLYDSNPIFPFAAFKAYYDFKLLEKLTLDGKDLHVVEGTIRNMRPQSGRLQLPYKVKCFIGSEGFIYRIESLRIDDVQQASVEYRNVVFNEGVATEQFAYTIPQHAFVMDIVHELEASAKHDTRR